MIRMEGRSGGALPLPAIAGRVLRESAIPDSQPCLSNRPTNFQQVASAMRVSVFHVTAISNFVEQQSQTPPFRGGRKVIHSAIMRWQRGWVEMEGARGRKKYIGRYRAEDGSKPKVNLGYVSELSLTEARSKLEAIVRDSAAGRKHSLPSLWASIERFTTNRVIAFRGANRRKLVTIVIFAPISAPRLAGFD